MVIPVLIFNLLQCTLRRVCYLQKEAFAETFALQKEIHRFKRPTFCNPFAGCKTALQKPHANLANWKGGAA